MIDVGWPKGFLEVYLKGNFIVQDGQFYEWARTERPQLWIDVYRKNKHRQNFDVKKKSGFSRTLKEMFFDYGLSLSLRSGMVGYPWISNFVFSFRSRKEAYRLSGLIQQLIPCLHRAVLTSFNIDPVRIFPTAKDEPTVSPRQEEVFQWLCEGKTDWEIANILKISPRGVMFHIQNLLRKFGAINRHHLVSKKSRRSLT